MKINLTQINSQTRQLREQAAELRSAQAFLLSYQHSLNTHWKGEEMTPTNLVIDEHRKRLAAIAADIDSVSNDIVREAEAIRRDQEVAEAQAIASAKEQSKDRS